MNYHHYCYCGKGAEGDSIGPAFVLLLLLQKEELVQKVDGHVHVESDLLQIAKVLHPVVMPLEKVIQLQLHLLYVDARYLGRDVEHSLLRGIRYYELRPPATIFIVGTIIFVSIRVCGVEMKNSPHLRNSGIDNDSLLLKVFVRKLEGSSGCSLLLSCLKK